jgi:hypothetical protein
MKRVILSVGLMLSFYSNAQWIKKNVDNGFDEPYNICYTAENNGAVLKLENVSGSIYFYLSGGYYCEEKLIVDISFMVNGTFKKYVEVATVSESNDIVWINDDLMNSEMINDFKSCSLVKLRVNDAVCDSETYSFSMSGSTSAITFINK